ncbi:MAG TPA: ATPase, T2SS/T4P/T4SS family [Gammaproteobacteria bacterium]|nr:ATPase, T2SS/T4P/T4SS family [Gammaproteobacteria bacterium]
MNRQPTPPPKRPAAVAAPAAQSAKPEGRLGLEQLLNWLLADKLILKQHIEQLRNAAPGRVEDTRHPLIRISEQGWVSATQPPYPLSLERLTRWLAERVGLPYLRIDPLKIDVEAVTKLVSQAYATRFSFLPIAVDAEAITVATAEPYLREWETELARILQHKIKRVIVNPKDVERYLKEFYGVSRSIFGATRTSSEASLAGNFESLTELGKIGEPDANDQHIVHLVDWLLQFAFEQRASDIHVEPRRELSRIRFRIDGMLHQVHELPTPIVTAITSRLKSLGRMDVADKRRPQDGRVKTKTPAGKEVEMRLSTMPTTFGEKLVLRIFDPQVLSRSFTELGFGEHEFASWQRMVENPHGFILVTGPTGSGKTTSLYCALKQLARPEYNVCSIEDPIEMVEPQFNQMQVQPAIDVDFATGVRTLLRQDPDIIMIGEIRDRETADVAIQAALTGHLVLSTLHTNDAPSAITRLIDIGVQPFLIGASLLGVVAQRLVRTLCSHCKKPGKLEWSGWQALTANIHVAAPKEVFLPVGCDECRHTGYLGRTGLYEILTMNREMRDMIRPHVDSGTLRDAAIRSGMRDLRQSGAEKIVAGITTLEEVLSVIPPQES